MNVQSVAKLTAVYDELSAEEIPLLRRHLQAAEINVEEAKHWTVLQFLQFIIKCDFVESLPYLTLTLRFFLTICVSVASCERSFSKMKLIKNYLRSTMSQSRLSDLAVLSIENELTRQTDFDELLTSLPQSKQEDIHSRTIVSEDTFFCALPCFAFTCSESEQLHFKNLWIWSNCFVVLDFVLDLTCKQ